MRGNNNRVIGDIIRKLMKNPKLAGKLDELDALEVWKELIGKQLQKYIAEARMIKGSLLIKVKSAPLRNELSYKKTDIIKQINTKLGRVGTSLEGGEEKDIFQREFDAEKSKLDKALKMDVISQEEYNEKLSKESLKLENFDQIRKVKKQYEMDLISKEEMTSKLLVLGD